MKDCVFCQIVNKERKAKIIYEDEKTLAFYDINPQAPYHILLIPKKHIINVLDLKEEDKELMGHIFLIANKISKNLNFNSIRIVTNSGKDAGQSVFHLHFHIFAGRKMGWPPG